MRWGDTAFVFCDLVISSDPSLGLRLSSLGCFSAFEIGHMSSKFLELSLCAWDYASKFCNQLENFLCTFSFFFFFSSHLWQKSCQTKVMFFFFWNSGHLIPFHGSCFITELSGKINHICFLMLNKNLQEQQNMTELSSYSSSISFSHLASLLLPAIPYHFYTLILLSAIRYNPQISKFIDHLCLARMQVFWLSNFLPSGDSGSQPPPVLWFCCLQWVTLKFVMGGGGSVLSIPGCQKGTKA